MEVTTNQRLAKLYASLAARAALCGWELVRMADGGFVASCARATVPLDDVVEAEEFIASLEGARA